MHFLANKMGLTVFVEGGTYKGDTALKASQYFEKVITIENSEEMYRLAKERIGSVGNIEMLQGDTRQNLRTILEINDNILFWLDAHWSGGETYGKDDECPLIDELILIFHASKKFVILIDDARMFLAPPPEPHKHEHWPSMKDIVNVLPKGWDIIVFEDVIYLFPEEVKSEFKKYIQAATTADWQKSSASPPFLKRFFK